jgi:hypothetical protein
MIFLILLKSKLLNFLIFIKTFITCYFYRLLSHNKSKRNKFHDVRLSAIGSIEMILILLVLISLIVIFKTQITSIINSIFRTIRDEIEGLI